MADYKSNVHSVYVNTNYLASDKLVLHGALDVSISDAGYDPVIMQDVTDRLVNAAGEEELDHQDFTFPQLHDYADLDYRLLRISGGIEYQVSPGVTVTFDALYADLNDNEGYVYGLESGNLFMIRSGVGLAF